MVAIAKITHPQKSNEWYTPSKYIEAARLVMGGIDLDPASCKLANETVQATRYFSKEDDGLAQEWYGRVWLNPPYGKGPNNEGIAASFARKMVREYQSGAIQQAIYLIYEHCLSTSWGGLLWDYPICFPPKRIAFYTDEGFSDTAAFGNIFVYLGPHEQKFIEVFSQFGRIAKAIA